MTPRSSTPRSSTLTLIAVSLSVLAMTGGAASANQAVAMNPATVSGIDVSSPASLRNAYRIHQRKRNIHAAHLNRLWDQERNLNAERDLRGRAGDMVSVQSIEQELYSVRVEIDQRRAALNYENRILSQIDERLARR